MRHYWDEPDVLSPPFFDPHHPDHSHEYTVLQGEALFCLTCFGMKSPMGPITNSALREETKYRGHYRVNLEPFFIERKPGDPPLNIVLGTQPIATLQSE